jgi:hypothetical protein
LVVPQTSRQVIVCFRLTPNSRSLYLRTEGLPKHSVLPESPAPCRPGAGDLWGTATDCSARLPFGSGKCCQHKLRLSIHLCRCKVFVLHYLNAVGRELLSAVKLDRKLVDSRTDLPRFAPLLKTSHKNMLSLTLQLRLTLLADTPSDGVPADGCLPSVRPQHSRSENAPLDQFFAVRGRIAKSLMNHR